MPKPKYLQFRLQEHLTEYVDEDVRILVSYFTPVAASIQGRLYVTTHQHSPTTSKHIKGWLNGRAAEGKSQDFFNDLLANGYQDDIEPNVVLGGIVILIQQPPGKIVQDEDAFIRALTFIPGFKSVDVPPIYFNGRYAMEAPSINMINGVIPLVFEAPDNANQPINKYINNIKQQVQAVWERFSI